MLMNSAEKEIYVLKLYICIYDPNAFSYRFF